MKWPEKVLMVKPNGFRVEYAINPYMLDSNGKLQDIDSSAALNQWQVTAATFGRLGLSVETIEGRAQFPDMVFAANQTLPVLDADGKQYFIMSRMKSDQRKGEVVFFKEWAEQNGIPVFAMTDFDFEGGGDAIWNYGTGELFGGYGFRTDPRSYDVLEERFGLKIHRVRLVSPEFYHMDTCFAVLNATTAAIVEEGFLREGVELIRSKFKTVIAIDPLEARQHFAGNCVALAGGQVVLQSGATKFEKDLRRHGLTPVPVETGEFIKAGGSVFCIKQLFW